MSRTPNPCLASWVDGAVTRLPHITVEQRYRAARRVATAATSATDAVDLLAVLGLTARDGKRAVQGDTGPVPYGPAQLEEA